MLPNHPIFEGNRPHSSAPAVVKASAVFAVMAAFSLLIIFLSLSPWIVLLLPFFALLGGLSMKNVDFFGLGVCVLITISLSYYYSLGQISGLVTIVRVVIILLLAFGFLKSGRESNEYRSALGLIALFLLISSVNSYYCSIYVSISELKLLFAGMFFFGLILSAKSTDGFPSILFGVIAAVISLSAIVFIIYPTIGYAYVIDPNAAISALGKFSGILNHPQLLACLLAINLPLILHTYLTRSGTLSTLSLFLIIATSLLMGISSSRTGLLATLVALVSTLYMLRNNPDAKARRRVNAVWAIVIIAIVIGLATSFEQIQLFIYKTEDLGGGISLSGREEIVGASWQAFVANPIFGNGFQVPSDFTEHGGATFGLSSDATAVEKCFFITMLLEEVGIVGTALFLGAIVILLQRWHQKRAYVAIAAMLAFLTINIGEACILSPSSIGGLCWLSIFAVHNLVQPSTGPHSLHDPARRRVY
jgi:O-antigen ligase